MKLSALLFCLIFSMNLQAQNADNAEKADASDNPVNNESKTKEGHITLNWIPTYTRENGDPLSLEDIDGYVVYYKKTASKKTFSPTTAEAIFIAEKNNLSANQKRSFTIKDLSYGNYCFAITTVALGLESTELGDILCDEVIKE